MSEYPEGGLSIPAYEAMLYGNTPICSNEGGPKDFIDPNNKNTGTLINGVYDICNQQDGAFEHIFTGRELWFHASEQETCNAMRYYYNNRNQKQCELDGSSKLKSLTIRLLVTKLRNYSMATLEIFLTLYKTKTGN